MANALKNYYSGKKETGAAVIAAASTTAATVVGGIDYSYDGWTWHRGMDFEYGVDDVGAQTVTSAQYMNGMFVVAVTERILDTTQFHHVLYISTDGIAWNKILGPEYSSTFPQVAQIAFGNGVYVATSYGKEIAYAYPSANGIGPWNTVTMPAIMRGVCYANGLFVIVGNNPYTGYSYDGITWIASSISSQNYFDKVIYGNDFFFTVGNGSQRYSAYSTNGIEWKLNSTSIDGGRVLVFNDDHGIFLYFRGESIEGTIASHYSTTHDGFTRNSTYSMSDSRFPNDAIWFEGRYLGAGIIRTQGNIVSTGMSYTTDPYSKTIPWTPIEMPRTTIGTTYAAIAKRTGK